MNSTLNIMQINIRSLFPKKDILETYLEKNLIDIAILSETFLHSAITIKFKNYHIHRRDRRDGYGGVAILVHKNFEADSISVFKPNYNPIENIEITVKMLNSTFKFIAIYIPPKSKPNIIESPFRKLLKENERIKNVIIAGDINAHHSLWENESINDPKGIIMSDAILETNFITLNNGEHTYQNLSRGYTSAIDITIATPNLANKCSWSIDENLTSDHLAIITTINHPKPTSNKYIKLINHNNISKLLQEQNFSTSTNITELENSIKNTIQENSKIIQVKHKFQPKHWWNEYINRLWLIKNFKQRIYNKTKIPYVAIELRKANNKLKNEIRTAKKSTWESYLQNINPTNNTKELWNKINKIRPKKTNHTTTLNSQQKAIDFLKHNYVGGTITLQEKQNNLPLENIFTTLSIVETINKAKNTASGTDNISYALLKTLPQEYAETIANHFNVIWKSQHFPEDWKQYKVIGIPKPDKDLNDIKNFRPISLLPVHLKIFNKQVKQLIENHLEGNNTLPINSYGFRRNFSTGDMLIKLLSTIEWNKNNKKHQLLLTVDFSKAFDKVDRITLMKILENYKLDENIINWINNFLSNRTMILHGENFSEQITTCEGLPQGSCIAPLLFNLYTTQLHSISSDQTQILQFADDFTIMIQTDHLKDLKKKTIETMEKFIKIAKKLHLEINIEKCHLMNLFTRKQSITEISIQGKKIKAVSSLKILGIHIDKNLNFTNHHNTLIEKSKKDINLIKILSAVYGGIHPKTSIHLYKSLIKSKIDYCSIITFISGSKNLEKIQKLKNRAIRTTLGLTKTTPVLSIMDSAATCTANYENELNILKHIIRRKYTDRNFKNFLESDKCHSKIKTVISKHNIIEKCPTYTAIKNQSNNIKLKITKTHENRAILKHNALDIINKYSQTHYIIYTDASINNNNDNRGLGIFHHNTKEEIKYLINNPISIKSAEIIAILIAVKQALDMKHDKICIFTDSLSSVKSIENTIRTQNNNYYENLIKNLAYLNPQQEIKICWIPAHIGLSGNEIADKIAKEATLSGSILNIKIDPKDIRNIIANNIWKEWENYYRNNTTTVGKHLAEINNFIPSRKLWFNGLNLPHTNIKTINRIRTGHSYNNKFLFLMKKRDTNICEKCNTNEIEDNNHIIFNCKAYESIRNKYNSLKTFNDTISYFKHITIDKWNETYEFLNEINIKI